MIENKKNNSNFLNCKFTHLKKGLPHYNFLYRFSASSSEYVQ